MKLLNSLSILFIALLICLVVALPFMDGILPAKKPEGRWEMVDSSTERLSIPGGWLVYRNTWKAGGMAFVPDENHEWRLDN